MTDLSALVVKLSAETSEYTASIQKATEQMSQFGEQVSDSVKEVAKELLGLEALKEVFEFSQNVVETIAHFESLSAAVGATTEQLSQLSFAGKLQGIDDIAVPLEKLARSAGGAATGNQKLIDSFASLGVSIQNAGGTIKPTDQLLLDTADAVSKYNDGLAKTSLVQAIFGRSNAGFIAFLDQGAAAIKKAQQEAIDLGVSVSTPTAKAAEEFEQNMTRIGAAVEGVLFKAIEAVLPEFQKITDEIVDFSKGAGNTSTVVEELAALFKIIASAAIVLGTDLQIAGTLIGETAGKIGEVVGDIENLADQIEHPADSLKKFGEQAKITFDDITNQILHPIDSLRAFSAQLDVLSADIVKAFTHPIDSINELGNAILHSLGLDTEIDQAKKGVNALMDVWGEANDRWGEEADKPKKLDLNLIDAAQIKSLASAIDTLAKLDDTLKQQVATFGLSGAAATVYDVTLGKLSASVDEINKKGFGQAQAALAQLEKQGKLSQASIAEINAAIAAGVPIGDAFKTAIINGAEALDKLKAVDALSKLDSQLLTMTGHLEAASQAAVDLANRPLRITIQTAQDKSSFADLTGSQKQIEATTQINALNTQAIAIQDELGKKVADVDAASVASGKSTLQTAGDEAAARQEAIAQLEALYVKAQALANATGLKSAAVEANNLRTAIVAIQFNPKIVDDVNAATAAQVKFNEVLKDEKTTNDVLSLQLADLAKQNAQGALSDLDYMAQQDTARQQAIDQLVKMEAAAKALSDSNPGNQTELDKYHELGIKITQLETQMGQLAKTVRDDLTNDLSSAFVDFADGSKTASAALKSFVTDFQKQMLDLAAKKLFQSLFESTGINEGINSLFGTAAKAAGGAASGAAGAASSASGLAGTSSAATAISTAMTTAATTGAASLGTGITTAATTGASALGTGITTATTAAATELGTGITTAGTGAATEMGAAIEAAGSAAAAEMAAAIAGASAAGAGAAGAVAAIGAAATGGPIAANQLTLVGEKGPELYVSDLGAMTAATATQAGTVIPEDLTHAHVIGASGPEYIKPSSSGFVVPSDVFLGALAARTATKALAGPNAKELLVKPATEDLGAPNAPLSQSLSLDPPISADILKFENVAKQQDKSHDLLSATEYQALLAHPYLEKRRDGGPVSAGKPYLVGEGGPELMVPDSNGTIMNSWSDSQNNKNNVTNVTNHFVINTPTGKVDRASQAQIAARTALSAQVAHGRNN